MYSFGWTCLIYHATTKFCRRNYSYKNDSLGKTVGQMVGAARSARQNIVEASSRAATSKEQELKQLDVAKGSLDELAGDFEAFIIESDEAPWSMKDSRYLSVRGITLDEFKPTGDNDHEYGLYTLAMRKRCAAWLENDDPMTAANAILVTIRRACALLTAQMRRTAEDFTHEGGFTERMSKARLAARDAATQAAGAPKCPKCGKPMRKVMCRKGRNAGNWFWSCTAYPDCDGTTTDDRRPTNAVKVGALCF